MKRRIAIKAAAIGAAPWLSWVGSPRLAIGQKNSKPALIGIPAISPLDIVANFIKPLKASLQDLGWVENRDIAFEIRSVNGDMARLAAVAQDVVRLNPDLIWTVSTPVTLAAQQATSTIPIVFVAVSDPVGVGLAKSLSNPGSNATGMTDFQRDYGPKLLDLLREALPKLSRVALVWNPLNAADKLIRQELQLAASQINVSLLSAEVARREALDDAFAHVARERAEAVIVSGDVLIFNLADRIDELLVQFRLPAAFLERATRRSHGFMSYGRNFNEYFPRSAVFVDRILKGAKPADLPIEQPTQLELVISLRAVEALGFRVPQSLRLRANEVIE